MTIDCRHTECRISKTTDTRSDYVVLIALPSQRSLHERTSILRYTCIVSFACLHVTYERLISEIKYPSSSMSKRNFAIFKV